MRRQRYADHDGEPATATSAPGRPAASGAGDTCWLRFIQRRAQPVARHCRVGAVRGDADAQYRLGLLYRKGEGVPQDDMMAARWFRRAAAQGAARAQYALAVLTATGCGVPRNDTEAVRWFRLAAAQGDVGALRLLGYVYDAGRGVPRSPVLAHFWWSLAATLGDRQARRERDRLAAGMPLERLALARRLARACLRHPCGVAGRRGG